jgi:hypothetical protein
MKGYLLRSLVAVFTFCIGLALSFVFGSGQRPFKHRQWEPYRCKRVLQFEQKWETFRSVPSPVLSIDTIATDPVKLLYFRTVSNPTGPRKQVVEFLFAKNSNRAIESVKVHYHTFGAFNGQGSVGLLIGHADAKASGHPWNNLERVSIDCDLNESLTVWVSSVEFSDGGTWNNPRHPNDN